MPESFSSLSPEAARVAHSLASNRSRVREQALSDLTRLGSEQAETLTYAFQLARRRRPFDLARRFFDGVVAGLFAMLALRLTNGKWEPYMVSGQLLAVLMVGFLNASFAQVAVARAVRDLEDKRLVGCAVDMLRIRDSSVREWAREALLRLLPQLVPADRRLLSPEQRAILNGLLVELDPNLVLAVLGAISQIGGPEDIAAVSRIAKRDCHAEYSGETRQAATECLEQLRARSEQVNDYDSLLRASDAPIAPPDGLLRAASSADPELLGNLLRPADE